MEQWKVCTIFETECFFNLLLYIWTIMIQIGKKLGFENLQEKLETYIQSRVLSWNRLIKERLKKKVIILLAVLYSSLEILRFLNFFTGLLSSFLSSKKSYILFINSNLSFAEYKTFIWWIRIFHVYQKIEAWKYLVKS